MQERTSLVVYRIDRDDLISGVGGGWDAFAQDNGAPGLARAVGISLWEAVGGAEVRELYLELLARVRGGARVAFPFRCDSPELRRFLEMEILPGPDEEVEFRSRVVRVEERREPVPLLEPSAGAGSEWMIVSCSWCRRFRVSGWVEVEEAIRELGLFGDAPVPAVSHGVCDDCLRRLVSDESDGAR